MIHRGPFIRGAEERIRARVAAALVAHGLSSTIVVAATSSQIQVGL